MMLIIPRQLLQLGTSSSVHDADPYGIIRNLLDFIFRLLRIFLGSRDSAVGIATGYGLDYQGGGSSSPGGAKIFTSPYRPDRLWGPPNLL
jgi:hypothetical protein